MSLAIAGMGWVTPLGNGVDPVWKQLLQGCEATAAKISEQFSDRSYNAFRVPESTLTALAPHPRLRRASVISRFAAAAGLEALQTAGVKIDSQSAERIALVFAISNGGVIYTKRFYRDIVEAGAQSASPLLFPETVFNAPASHLAAILGITGTTYTLVGDSAVGLLAIKMADDLMASEALDYCLVVGAEEADWILCDAYRRWRLLRLAPPIEPFNKKERGMILSEGAGAVLLARDGPVVIECTHPGMCYQRRSEAEQVLKQILYDLGQMEIDFVISSANGTFIDRAECQALRADHPGCVRLHGQASDGRKRRRCGTVAGDRGYPGFAQRGTSAVASWRVDNSATDFGLAHARGRCPTRNRFELWSQSASSRFATQKEFATAHDFRDDPMIGALIHRVCRSSRHQCAVLLALQEAVRTVPSASAMRKPVFLLAATLLASAGLIKGEIKTPENAPIEITSTGETTYENGLATARDNVAIHIGDTDIYADYAQYNSNTHEIELRGHVRIYRDASFYIAESGVFNTETKRIRAIETRTTSQPYFVSGENVSEISDNGYLVKNGTFTTHDTPKT